MLLQPEPHRLLVGTSRGCDQGVACVDHSGIGQDGQDINTITMTTYRSKRKGLYSTVFTATAFNPDLLYPLVYHIGVPVSMAAKSNGTGGAKLKFPRTSGTISDIESAFALRSTPGSRT